MLLNNLSGDILLQNKYLHFNILFMFYLQYNTSVLLVFWLQDFSLIGRMFTLMLVKNLNISSTTC